MIPLEAQAAARSAYRAIFRATASTFKGDDRLLKAFRSRTRAAYAANRTLSDPSEYDVAVAHARDVATILRRNVVQAVQRDDGVWDLRLTPDTELGGNDTVRKPGDKPTAVKYAHRSFSTAAIRNSTIKAKIEAHRSRTLPTLREEDIDESFVRGSGPGGQAINKTSSCVNLLHRPTGIRVSAQPTRSRDENRKIARKILLDKLDQLMNPGLSKADIQRDKVRERKRQRAKKANKKKRAAENQTDEPLTPSELSEEDSLDSKA